MIDNHISIEEISRFILYTKPDDEYFRLSAKIHTHIKECPDCRKTYEAMINLEDAFDHMVSEKTQKDRMTKLQIINLLEEKIKKSVLDKITINIENMRVRLEVNIPSFLNLEPMSGYEEYVHPHSLVFAKSTDVQEKNKIMKSVLVYSKTNTVTIGQDASLTVVLTNDMCGESKYAVLVSEDLSDIYVSRPRVKEGKKSRYTFLDISLGEYKIFV